MSLEIVSRRFLTDPEIRAIQERERVEMLLRDIKDEVSYNHRNDPLFSVANLTRRRLFQIAGLSAASLSLCGGFGQPASAAGPDLGSLATLIGRWQVAQPQLQAAKVLSGSSAIAHAPVVSTVSYAQPSQTIAVQLEDHTGALENSTSQPVTLDAYEKILFRYVMEIARTIPPGRKRLLFFTKIAKIFAALNVVEA